MTRTTPSTAATIPVVFRRHMAAPPGSSAGCQNLVCAIAGNGIKIAVVSNCDENTRDLLVELGVAALADALVLSCEVGAAKPAGAIFHRALDQLGLAAGAAGHVRARGGADRSLLPTAGGEAEHLGPRHVGGKPVVRYGLVPDEHHRPVAGPGPGDDVGPDRQGPLISLVHLAVPGSPVIRNGVKVLAGQIRTSVSKRWVSSAAGSAVRPLCTEVLHVGLGAAVAEPLRRHQRGHLPEQGFGDPRGERGVGVGQRDGTVAQHMLASIEGPLGIGRAPYEASCDGTTARRRDR